MAKIYSREEVRDMIKAMVARKNYHGVKMAAGAFCVSPAYVSQALHGGRIGAAFLEYLGLRKVHGKKDEYQSTIGE